LNKKILDIVDELNQLLGNLTRLLTDYDMEEVLALSPRIEYLYDIPLLFDYLRKQVNDQILRDERILLLKRKLSVETCSLIDILKKLEQEVKSIEVILNKYPNKESLSIELLRNRYLLKHLVDNINSHNEKLSKFNNGLSLLELSIRRLLTEIVFKGREGLRERKELKSFIEVIESIKEYVKEYEDFCTDVYIQLINFIDLVTRWEFRDDYLKTILSQIYARIEHGLWAKNILDILTGLQSITASPVTEHIRFILGDEIKDEDKEVFSLSLRELFLRYPPFEPIALWKNILLKSKYGRAEANIAGSHVWFIESPNLTRGSLKILRLLKTEADNIVVNAYEDSTKYVTKLKEIIPVNVISRLGELTLEIRPSNTRFPRNIWIKYGSKWLRDLILRQRRDGRLLQTIYEKEIAKKRGTHYKAYRVDNLSYAWFCVLGQGLSTDPWDFEDCPFKDRCFYGRHFKSERCRYWSYSRRIFPKVFPTIEKKIYGLSLKGNKGLLIPIKATSVLLNEMYTGVQWNMPSTILTGIPIQIRFKKRLIRSLPKTNIVGFAIPLKVIYTFIDSLLDPSFKPMPEILPGINVCTTMLHLIYTKFYLYHKGARGFKVYGILSKREKGLLCDYKDFIEKLDRDLLRNFIIQTLGHTLAHLLVSFLTESLELEYQDLIYYYYLDNQNNLLIILVAENSPYGSLNIVEHVYDKFGNIENMLKEFIKKTSLVLKKHKEDLENYRKQRKIMFQRYGLTDAGKIFKPLIEEISKYYDKLVLEGLVLDSNYFALHLVLSHVYDKIVQKLKIDQRLALRELDNILTYAGPVLCLDGCTGCIVFERGCEDPLVQTLTLSKHITQLFLDIFFNGLTVITQGNRFGSALIEALPRREILVVSPYVDKEGLDLLQRLAENGVRVTLITRRESIKEHIRHVKGIRIGIPKRAFHEKIFIIDEQLIINTSWNLTLRSSSTNQFRIEYDPNRASQLKKQIESEVDLIE